MKKFILISMILFVVNVYSENSAIANVAKNLQFSGSWKVANGENETTKLKKEDLLLAYNGSADYPKGSGYHVAESKTFAKIIVAKECGFKLPGGYDYAKRPISEAKVGCILQKKAPEPHTMLVLNVNKEEVKVLHSNWAGYHRIAYATFSKKYLQEQGFKVFIPGVDKVKSTQEAKRKIIKVPSGQASAKAFGTYRIVITGEIPYHRISQGTIVSHSGPGGKIVVNETRTVSNTFSCEVGVSVDIISAKVGFSVTQSFSRSLSYWRDVTPGKYGYVDLYYKYMVKKFDVYYKPLFGDEYFAGSGKAYKWQAVEFQYRESNS